VIDLFHFYSVDLEEQQASRPQVDLINYQAFPWSNHLNLDQIPCF